MEKSSENKIYRAIGFMSGTAMDGIDAALIETDGYDVINRVGFTSAPYQDGLRQALRANLNQETYDPMVESQFTLAHIAVMDKLLSQTGFSRADIDIIGFHGQTTHHDPDKGITVQMGNGELLAHETDIDVVYDFRKNDMVNGGQGAPFLPVYHRALVQNAALKLPIIVLNLGGVGNITWISGDNMIAFDTGPANAMIDDWVKDNTSKTYDENGDIAKSGQSDGQKIAAFLSHPYFDLPYPKSLDRNGFDVDLAGMSLEDGAATLTEMTVQSVAKGVKICPETPSAIYVTGGGRHNAYMMQCLRDTTGIEVQSVDTLGWNGDAMEAEGFAYMAVRSLLSEPISFPNTTGCSAPTAGGLHAKPNKQAA